jgi:hypothetical protein
LCCYYHHQKAWGNPSLVFFYCFAEVPVIVVGWVTAAGDVGVAGAVGAVDAAVGADAGIEPEPEFEFDVGATMFGIEVVVDGLEVTKEEVGEETVGIANGVEHAGEGPDTVVAVVAVAAAGVEVVGIDASVRYIVGADIGEEAEDYVGVALEKRS